MSNYQAKVTTSVDFGKLNDLESKLTKMKTTNLDIKVSSSGLDAALSKMKQMQTISKSLGVIKFGASSGGGGSSTANAQVSALSKLQKAQEKVTSSSVKLQSVRLSTNVNSLKAKGMDTTNLEKSISSIKKLETELNNLSKQQAAGKLDTTGQQRMVDTYQKLQAELKKTGNEYQILKTQQSQLVSSTDAMTASNKIRTWLKNNSKALKDYGNDINDVADKMSKVTTVGEKNMLQKQFQSLTARASAEGKTGMSFLTNLKRGASQIGQFVGVYGVFQRGMQAARQMAAATIEVDTAMTELRKVSDAPSSQVNSYFEMATASAKKYGATISDVISSTADWSRLGYGLKDASQLSDVTTLFQRVGDNMTQESASKSLVSTLKGFELDSSQAKSVLDKYNSVANNYAIDTAGIGEALQNSASSFNSSNTSLSKSLALIAGTNEVAQDPSAVGNMWKTKLNKNCLYVQKCA